MIEIKNDGVRKLYGTQETEQTSEYGVLKLTVKILNRRNENILCRTYEDIIPLETQPTEPTEEPATEPTEEPTQPTEQTEPQPTTEAGEEIAIPDTSEPTEAEN